MTAPRRVDLNASRRARDEKAGTGPVVELGFDDEGKVISFELPSRLPAAVPYGLALMAKGEVGGFADAVAALFGDRVDEALRAGLEMEDLSELAALYAGDDDPGN